jgi:hypothetical protein
MNLKFLFLDESKSEPLDSAGTQISSLTGLLVPAESYPLLRATFYDALAWSIQPGPGIVNMSPPELHGCDLLRSEDDERKVEVLGRIVDLVVNGGVGVYRVGYYVTEPLKQAFQADPGLLGLCWLGVLAAVQPVLGQFAIVPVMDMGDRNLVRILSGLVRSLDILRSAGSGPYLSIVGTERLLGEVFYADSAHSVFVQVADLVSYLRLTSDLNREGRHLSPFRQRILELARKLAPAIICDNVIALKHNGEIQRPLSPVGG